MNGPWENPPNDGDPAMELKSFSYASPILRYDPVAEVVILAHRNTDTGDVSSQIPSPETVKAQRAAVQTGTGGLHVSVVV